MYLRILHMLGPIRKKENAKTDMGKEKEEERKRQKIKKVKGKRQNGKKAKRQNDKKYEGGEVGAEGSTSLGLGCRYLISTVTHKPGHLLEYSYNYNQGPVLLVCTLYTIVMG